MSCCNTQGYLAEIGAYALKGYIVRSEDQYSVTMINNVGKIVIIAKTKAKHSPKCTSPNGRGDADEPGQT